MYYRRMMLSVFRCSKIYNFQNVCGIQYVPFVWLEMTSNLDDHSTSLVNMVTTNGKKTSNTCMTMCHERSVIQTNKKE